MPRPKKKAPRSDKRYEFKGEIGRTADNKQIRKAFYSYISVEDAKKKYIEYMTNESVAAVTGISKDKNNTFKELAEEVLEFKKPKIRANTYYSGWENPIKNHLIPYFGSWSICNITRSDIERYFLSKQNYAMNFLKKDLCCLKAIFDLAIENRIIFSSPCHKYKIEVGKPQAKKCVYNETQINYILDFCSKHKWGVGVDLMLRCGMSRSEILGLQFGDVDFEKKIIHIQRGVTTANVQRDGKSWRIGEPKNKNRNRFAAISDQTVELIKGMNQENLFIISEEKDKPLGPHNWDLRYENFMREMREYYLKQGIDIPILNQHELRHSRATLWIHKGVNLYAVKEQMGWSDLKMLSKVYGHGNIEILRDDLDL